MKKINISIATVLLSFWSVSFGNTVEKTEPKTKIVCKKERDRNGQEKEVCRTIKIHKKLEGTKVPQK